MTQQLRVAGALGAAIAALMALALPVAILLLLDPASSCGVWRHPDRPGPEQRARRAAKVLADLRGRRPAVRARQRRLGVPRGAELRREHASAPTTAPAPACSQAATTPGRPARCKSGSAAPRPTTGQPSSDRSRPTCPAVRSRRASTTRPTPSTAPRSCSSAWERPGTGTAALVGVEQLPARDRPGHPARRAVHQHRPGARRRARRVGDAGVRGRAGVRAGERPHDPGRGRTDPAQRARRDPTRRAAGGAGDDRGRQPDHRLPLQLGRRARAGVDESAARPRRRPGKPGERRPGL